VLKEHYPQVKATRPWITGMLMLVTIPTATSVTIVNLKAPQQTATLAATRNHSPGSAMPAWRLKDSPPDK